MGYRANYVLIENGQAHIFFSRWGGLTLPSVLLSGPEALPPEDQPEIRFGTRFFSKDASPLSPQERRDVLNRLFSGLLENDQMKRGEEHSL